MDNQEKRPPVEGFPFKKNIVSSSQRIFHHMEVAHDTVFWTEGRPLEGGRHALMKKQGENAPIELFPDRNIQTRVHEYGGGAFSVFLGHIVFFDETTSSLCFCKKGQSPIDLQRNSLKKYADFSFSPDAMQVLCVCEDRSREKTVHYLACIDLNTGKETIVHDEFAFYASPRWSPSGEKIAFLAWNNPHMPWESCGLYVMDRKTQKELLCIMSPQEAISQFLWDQEDLLFVSDRNGFSNLYLANEYGQKALLEIEGDITAPLWILGKKNIQRWKFNGKEGWIVTVCQKGEDALYLLEKESEREWKKLELPYTVIRAIACEKNIVYMLAGSPEDFISLISLNLDSKQIQVVCEGSSYPKTLRPFLSLPRHVVTTSSLDGEQVYGFFYPPSSFIEKSSTLPPLIVKCHSGPTLHVAPLLQWEVQYWTSRGFAWLDVNYRGSSGFGRRYREALDGNWGVVDVQDCWDMALELCRNGLVDKNAIFVKGSSAGGFTALCMAASFPDIKGCVSAYGVTDLTLLAEDTHSFEQYYLQALIGDEKRCVELYKTRSPCYQVDKISCPVLFFHGGKDRVVPLMQAEEMHKKLSLSKLCVFPEEGHGFRRAETIEVCLEEEEKFYKKQLLRKETADNE